MKLSAGPAAAAIFAALAIVFAPRLDAQGSPPSVKILVNQAGYDLENAKSIMLQANFEPTEIADFEIIRGGAVVAAGAWPAAQPIRPWNQWYSRAELPALAAGTYRVRVPWRGGHIESVPFRVEPQRLACWTGPLASYFFFAQRCGCDVPGWHGPCHLDDGKLADGSHRGLAGGWHDAGDYNKYNGYAPLAVYALAKFAQSPAARTADWSPGLPLPVEESLWGAKWLEKCRDAATGRIIGQVFSGFAFWGRPEDETDNISGNADDRPIYPLEWNRNEMTAAAWAALFRATGDTHWQGLALGMWDIIEAHDPGLDLDQRAERLLAAAELGRSAPAGRFEVSAERDALELVARQEPEGGWPPGSMAIVDYGLVPAALAEFVRAFPASPGVPAVRYSLGRYLDFWAARRLQPFSVPKWSEADLFFPPSPGAWYVGQNSMYLSTAWAGSIISKVLGDEGRRARGWAADSLDWVLGLNPLGVCLMSGAGTVHLARYHHRYDQIPNGKNGNIPGAIANGIVRLSMGEDAPYIDLEGNWWRTNEPWLPHNAYYLLALSELGGAEPRARRTEFASKMAVKKPAT